MNHLNYVHVFGTSNLNDEKFSRICDEIEEKISRFESSGKRTNSISVNMDSLTKWDSTRNFAQVKVPKNLVCRPT